MISPAPSLSDGYAVHLVAPPSTRPNTSAHFGRTTPCLLLAGALKDNLTPPPPHSRVMVIGDSSTPATASAIGIPHTDHFTPVLANPNSLKRKILSQLSTFDASPSRIICWSDELISLASSIASSLDIPTELISTKPSTIKKPPQSIDTIRVFEPQDHDRWLDLRHTCQTDQLLASLIDADQPTQQERSDARSKLNIDDQTIVLGAVADAPNEVDAREFAFLLGLLAVSGYQLLGIIPKTAKNLNQALRHHRGLDQPFRILTTTEPLPSLIPLLDAYIHPNNELSGSTHLVDRLLQRADIPILNLRHSGKAGFSRAQGAAGLLLDEMDHIVESMNSQLA